MKKSKRYLPLLSIILTVTTGTVNAQNKKAEIKASATAAISAQINYIEVDGSKIAYKVIGKGKPIVFLQRFRGTMNDWDPAFTDAVAKEYKVILFDAPGVGLSGGTVPTSITEMAEQAVTFTTALGIKKATYLGWSMGGAIAQAVAVNHKDKVDKLVLLATGPSSNPEFLAGNPEFGIRARKLVYEFEDNQFLFFYSSPAAKAACKSYLERIGTIKQKDPATRLESYENMTLALKDFKANKERNYYDSLKDITCPTLIANGKFDPSYPMVNSLVLAREIPNSKLIIYPDSGHGFLFQYHEEFSAELLNFLNTPEKN